MLEPRQLQATGASPPRTGTTGTLRFHRNCRGSVRSASPWPALRLSGSGCQASGARCGFRVVPWGRAPSSTSRPIRRGSRPSLLPFSVCRSQRMLRRNNTNCRFLASSCAAVPSLEPLTSRAQQQQPGSRLSIVFSRSPPRRAARC
jgi:hypothetical protein